MRVASLATLALTRLLAGDEGGAGVAARAALDDPDAAERPLGLVIAASTLAILDAWQGRIWSARGHADVALTATRASGLTARSPGSWAQLADVIVATTEGRLGHAQRAAERALRGTIEGGLWHAWTLLELTTIQLRRGHAEVAARSLDQADELLAVAGDAGRLPARAADCGARSPRSARRPTPAPAEPPSPAELSVLRLLPGSTVREIGEALFLSPNTVKSHLRSLYRKLGVNSRDDAVARAVALGLIDDPAS